MTGASQRVIDAHHHLWQLRPGTYPWLTDDPPPELLLGDFEPIRRDYTIDDYLADTGAHNVVASVHVEAGLDANDPIAETRWLQGVAGIHGFPHAIVAYAQLEAPDVDRILTQHASYDNVRGVRQMVSWHPDPVLSQSGRGDYLIDPAWRRGFALLERHGLVFDLQVYPAQMADAAALAGRHPSAQLVVEHAGMPIETTPDAMEGWRSGMRLLSAQPNVTVKLSGIGMADHAWTPADMRRLYGEVIELFGADRCMFGSNFPVDGLFATYDHLVGSFHSLVAELSQTERDLVLYRTAKRVYRIPS